jgi:hypothetical protein
VTDPEVRAARATISPWPIALPSLVRNLTSQPDGGVSVDTCVRPERDSVAVRSFDPAGALTRQITSEQPPGIGSCGDQWAIGQDGTLYAEVFTDVGYGHITTAIAAYQADGSQLWTWQIPCGVGLPRFDGQGWWLGQATCLRTSWSVVSNSLGVR